MIDAIFFLLFPALFNLKISNRWVLHLHQGVPSEQGYAILSWFGKQRIRLYLLAQQKN